MEEGKGGSCSNQNDNAPLRLGERESARHHQPEEPLDVIVMEWSIAAEHDVRHDPDGPDITLAAIAVLLQYLRRNILRCPAGGGHGGATVVVQPCETEIRELDEIPGRGAEFHIKPNHVNTQQYVRAI